MFAHMIVLGRRTGGPTALPVQAADQSRSQWWYWRFLSAGFGLPADAAFPARLQKALKSNGIDVNIGNAGVSGDTSSGGRDRLDWSVPEGTEA